MRNIAALAAPVSLDEILARADVWCADQLATAALPTLASGFPVLDEELPGGGWPRGALCEILADAVAGSAASATSAARRGIGIGEFSLLMPVLKRMRTEGRWSLLIAPPFSPNGPALSVFGVDLARLAVVNPEQPKEILWAMEHALSSGAFGCVLAWGARIDARQIRRLQVAAAGHDTLAFLFRPLSERASASSATLRLALSTAAGGMLGVDLLKRRGPPCTRTLLLDVARPATRTRTCEEDRSAQSGDERTEPAPRPAHLRAVRSNRHAPRTSLARTVSSGVAAGSVRPASVA